MGMYKKIILWGREDVLGQAVEIFLSSRKGWEVTRISDTQNIDMLFQAVRKIHPDVVILHEGDCFSRVNIPVQLTQENPGIKVIAVSLENNAMEIYDSRKLHLEEINSVLRDASV